MIEMQSKPPAPEQSGFFSSTSVKTLLTSGSALFIFSVYLFIRSHWEAIPDEVKFSGLAFLTALIYGSGYMLMNRKLVPVTSKTLLGIGLGLIPFNVVAANKLLFNNSMTTEQMGTLGSALMLAASSCTALLLPTVFMGICIGLSAIGLLVFGQPESIPNQIQLLVLACGTLLIFLSSLFSKIDDKVRTGLFLTSHFGVALVMFALWPGSHFFLKEPSQLISVFTLLVLGGIYSMLSRVSSSKYAYLAGSFYLGAAILFMHQFHLRLYEMGYGLVPAGFIALLRAWTFERSGRERLAQPYSFIGQVCLLVSICTVAPGVAFPREASFIPLLIILSMASMVYAAMGVAYRNSAYTYATGFVLLYLGWGYIWQTQADFSFGVLFFSMIGSVLMLFGMAGTRVDEDKMGQPLIFLGLGTMSIALALLAGKWGQELLSTGSVLLSLPPEQIRAGLWTGGLCVLAYSFMAIVKKRWAFVYPALLSATWVYICFLTKLGIAINLLNMSGIVMISMLLFYLGRGLGWKEAAISFSLWGEMAAIFIFIAAILSNSQTAFPAVLFCTLAFLPALLVGGLDLTALFLTGSYVAHFVWFRQWHPFTDTAVMAEYGLQLVAMNFGVVFIRSLVSRARPEISVLPYQLIAIGASTFSLILALNDFNVAYQVYLAYGILAIVVSLLHYQGRYMYIGTTLLVLACELYVKTWDVSIADAYTIPIGLYAIAAGYALRKSKETRDFLYGAGQVIIYLPSSINAMMQPWELRGILLGLIALTLMLLGIHQRNKILTFPSAFALVINGFVQSRQLFLAVPRWIYLGVGGLSLISLGGLFEFKRDALLGMKKQVVDTFEDWD